MSTTKDILILGHPRSGTGYMAKLMQSFGMDVGHEKLGEHGISDWMFAVRSDDKPWGHKSNLDLEFRHIIHVIREPIAAINSIAWTENLRKKSLNYRKRYVLIPDKVNPVRTAVYSYLGWNQLIKSWHPDLTIKLEAHPIHLFNYLKQHYPVQLNQAERPSPFYNARQHTSFSYDQIMYRLDPPMADMLEKFINEYNSL